MCEFGPSHPLASCVASDELLNPAESQFPHLSNVINNIYCLWLLRGKPNVCQPAWYSLEDAQSLASSSLSKTKTHVFPTLDTCCSQTTQRLLASWILLSQALTPTYSFCLSESPPICQFYHTANLSPQPTHHLQCLSQSLGSLLTLSTQWAILFVDFQCQELSCHYLFFFSFFSAC
jgi:hypothetical protein